MGAWTSPFPQSIRAFPASGTAETTIPTNGSIGPRSSTRTSASFPWRASTSSPSAYSPGPASSPRRAATSSPGSTASWIDSPTRASKAALATPSGSKPAWMAQKYPEILRCGPDRVRDLHGSRHNHCYTSPAYRRKAVEINYAPRRALQGAIPPWRSGTYPTSTAASATAPSARRPSAPGSRSATAASTRSTRPGGPTSGATATRTGPRSSRPRPGERPRSWDSRWIGGASSTLSPSTSSSPSPRPCARLRPNVPITVNMMGTYPGPRLLELGAPRRRRQPGTPTRAGTRRAPQGDADEASRTAFVHDLNRSLKGGKPWLLMESTPSQVNWQSVNRLKKPGMHRLSSLQAVAHGSDSVMYFQWRKGRGGAEKFHGAVVDHVGHEDARVFREVPRLGRELEGLADVAGTAVQAEAAVIYDWETRWAIDGFHRLRQGGARLRARLRRALPRALEAFHSLRRAEPGPGPREATSSSPPPGST